MDLAEQIGAYLSQVTGSKPAVTSVATDVQEGLPVYLSHAYDLYELVLFGRSLSLAIPRQSPRPSLLQMEKDRRMLAARLDREVVLAVKGLRPYERRDLVKRQVPFIVPGCQLFLPMLLVDLREHFSRAGQAVPAVLSWPSQVIVLKHLLNSQISGRALSEIAALLGYSAMAITLAVDELAASELCVKQSRGRMKTIEFPFESMELWQRAFGRMRSPVRKRHFLQRADIALESAFASGLTALSARTNLTVGGIRTFALPHGEIRRMLTAGEVECCLYEEDAVLAVEGWAYRPDVLCPGPSVDDLSLYLSLKDEPDERVQMAAASLLEGRKWL